MKHIVYFFRSIPEGYDIQKYDIAHIVLILIAFLGAVFIYRYRNRIFMKNKKIPKVFAVILFFQQLILYSWYLICGTFSIETSLPIYDCRIAIICLIVGVFFNKVRYKRIGLYIGFVGSIVAIISPELDKYIFPHYTWVSFFVGHIFLLWISCYVLLVDKIELSVNKYKEIFIFTNIIHLLVLVFNFYTNSNYAYLLYPPIFTEVAGSIPQIIYTVIMICILNIYVYISHMYFVFMRKKDEVN